jgi:hypothetical protein
MRGERLKEIIDELRGLVEQAQDALDERPVLQRLLTALRAKVSEAQDEDEQSDQEKPDEPQP